MLRGVGIGQNRILAVMIRTLSVFISSCCFISGAAFAQLIEADVRPFIEVTCMKCHGAETETPLNLEELDYDLTNPATFRRWEHIFDRVRGREMPPRSEPRPKRAMVEQTLSSLKGALLEANLAARQNQRVTLRRLTRVEYEYTIHDLLLVYDAIGKLLPPDNDSASFDTVASGQQISPIHVRSYLEAADHALDSAIQLGRRPAKDARLIDYLHSPYVERWHVDTPLNQGGSITKKLDDAIALFLDTDWIMRSDRSGFRVDYPGMYRLRVVAYAYQAETPVTLMLIQANEKQGGSRLLGAFDLNPDEIRAVEVTTFLQPNDFLYPTVADIDVLPDGTNVRSELSGALYYKGEGLAIKSLTAQGPLVEMWPPRSTRDLLTGVGFIEREAVKVEKWGPAYDIELTKEPMEHVSDIVARLATLAFRRPPKEGEVESFARLAGPAIAEGQDFVEVVRIPLRAILSSPQFLYHGGDAGELDDFALAARLSYFLWKSMPDKELYILALFGKLSEPEVLARQVDRMLDDEKSMRFVKDFVGQWLRLREIGATTPSEKLYPEYDDVLHRAISRETELFFAELIAEDLGVRNIIDSDFTFVNRRLAEHYGVPGIEGQQMRKVVLAEDSPRGGILTQASILKITANGTVTSPVRRGNFVLTNLLGQPPSPPPPNVNSNIEPDTRGTTTIRETLSKHRTIETCASCHRTIDPPGFALESFDPIGGFRTRYRSTQEGDQPEGKLFGRAIHEYKDGLEVDPSDVTPDGKSFSGIGEFKEILLQQEDQIARNFISQLVVYATGGEIQFADRDELSKINEQTRDAGYPVRSIIHEIVQSNLFRNK